MSTEEYFAMTAIVILTIVICVGVAVSALISHRRHKRAYPMCTTYSRCPECRAQEEPPSHLDWLDRFR